MQKPLHQTFCAEYEMVLRAKSRGSNQSNASQIR